ARRGQRLEGLAVERASYRGVRGLERRGALDRDRFLQVADLEREVQREELLGADVDALVLDALEALHRDLEAVVAGIDVDERVLTEVVRLGGAVRARRLVGQRDRDSGHHPPRLTHGSPQATMERMVQR